MSEKVLGFQKKDSLQDNHKNFFDEAICLVIPKSKLVPVVSIKRLEEYCKNFKGSFNLDGKFNAKVDFVILKFYFKKLLDDLRKESNV